MIEVLIEKVFSTRNAAHIEHWGTKSFAQHEALGEFYEDVISSIDKLVEAYKGVEDLAKDGAFKKQENVIDIISRLEDDLSFIDDNRKDITKGRQALDNILQELEGVYMTALYKLKNFS